uniref:Uncharacterized protein n=1 Tax=Octopus bimaculoides TaxID=37653 RepID=A0A0L8GP01_OCTBM
MDLHILIRFRFKTHHCHVFNHNPLLGESMHDKIIHFRFDSVTSATSSSFTPSFLLHNILV